ncbi:TKL protein kinase [Phytophthora nicotianae P10297]|uniref:TKL protein kinase n=2 Tax=Phytophthora nicotianae TaxID=4792 RepID=W2RA45_PHYN3|nr:TKL protein kinase [Phytophthora nicotianae INRA-310]ETN21579.1 TKL protein kinase [Phytophthora nicotianae INRA-310]ETP42952.1 TKL protein kinase [Phytophthora nicotianae P10297]
MRVFSFLSLFVATANAACSRDTTALTSDCSSQCYQGRPCIAFAADASCNATTFGTCVNEGNSSSGSAADSCAFECFVNGPKDFAANGAVEFTEYVFFIPYGSEQSKWEANWTSSQASTVDTQLESEVDETQFYPSESNLVFKDIEPLTFQTETTTVMFVGGTSVWGVRGKVSQVKLSAQFLSENTQLKNITMVNLGFDTDPPQSTFPTTNVESFRMSNCLLSTYPADLEFMTSVVHVDFSQNYFKDYPVKFSHASMESLNLSTNALTACSGDFPNMKNLYVFDDLFQHLTDVVLLCYSDLSGNTLTEIPSNILDMPKLKVLNLSGNSFTDVSLTAEQVTFFQSLETFTIDTFGDTSQCSESARVEISGVTVCTGTGNAESSSSSDGGSNVGAIVGGVVGAIVVAIVLGVAFFYYRRRKAHGKGFGTFTGFSDPTHRSGRGGASLWNDQELLSLQVNPDDIEDIRKLGAGAFGVVYLAKYRQNRLVACKRLKKGEATFENTQNFIAEIKLCATLDHPRVVQLLGVAWTIESDLQAMFEYMSKGDLRTFLEKTKAGPKIWNAEKLQLAADVTEALVYVHSFAPPIVHRDLKSRNVLLSEDTRGHLSDFGVARVRSANNTMTSGVGTGRWLAPEVIAGNRNYDQTSDIFALGVVMSELDTHMLPYEDARGAGGNPLADVAILQLVASGKLLPTFGSQCPPEIHELAKRCMAYNPQDRPTAVEVAFALRTLHKSGAFN